MARARRRKPANDRQVDQPMKDRAAEEAEDARLLRAALRGDVRAAARWLNRNRPDRWPIVIAPTPGEKSRR